MPVNWLELIISYEDTGKILYHNTVVTNHKVSLENAALLARVGRTPWKIENENNNTLKTTGYHLEHNFGHGQQNPANILATLNIPAFLIHTVQEITEPTYQLLRCVLGKRKTFFEDLRALTRYMVFDTWDDLFLFMRKTLKLYVNSP